ncbi:(2Fe-2S) ferredoxin domain-containing protein [Bacillus sp. FJAT-45350]|uniref:(2Fe-2S) ferredoxin domain-containing protein n=1 Tax=Bacillus sp. FJAT-45350 TaxID=2011014 RepID=UPI000BB6EEE0|nr:(2Fe-2S) ferredoxin domain-containing protein [Bacillus sp. FJAT-45350]
MATWDLSNTNHHLLICNGGSCNKSGAEELTLTVRNEISNRGLDNMIHTTRTRCNGRCKDKCVVVDYPKGDWYQNMEPEDVSDFIDSLCANQTFSKKLALSYNGAGFESGDGTVTGDLKNVEVVSKVSKVYE